MGIEVTPLGAQSVMESARLLGQAFLNDPVWVFLFQGLDETERKRRMTWVFAASLAACLKAGVPLQVRDQGRLVAAATVYPPKAYPLSLPQEVALFARSMWHGGPLKRDTWAMAGRALGLLGEVAKEHPAGPHYYLEYIGVAPDCQGQGIGTFLVKALFQRADLERAGCYLESANPRAVPLYERLGFQTTLQRTISGVHLWFMWRHPEPLPALP